MHAPNQLDPSSELFVQQAAKGNLDLCSAPPIPNPFLHLMHTVLASYKHVVKTIFDIP